MSERWVPKEGGLAVGGRQLWAELPWLNYNGFPSSDNETRSDTLSQVIDYFSAVYRQGLKRPIQRVRLPLYRIVTDGDGRSGYRKWYTYTSVCSVQPSTTLVI